VQAVAEVHDTPDRPLLRPLLCRPALNAGGSFDHELPFHSSANIPTWFRQSTSPRVLQ
jgi:hypothetical protein